MYKCSVITPLFHGKKYIPGLIACLEACARTAPGTEIELILSGDAPGEIIEERFFSDNIMVKILNTDQNRGIHGARVRGFWRSAGDYIVFLDQDDKLLPAYFASQLQAIGTADAVVCNALSGGRMKYNTDRPLCKAADRESMITEGNMILSPGQVLIKREAVPEKWLKNVMQTGGADDWLLWLCMHSENRQFAVNETVLFLREVHYGNASFDSGKMSASEREAVEIIRQENLLCASERKSLEELLPKLQDNRIRENEKWKKMFLILNDWFCAQDAGVTVSGYLAGRGMKRAAVYGYGYLGKTLCGNLEGGRAEISCIIDKNAGFLEMKYRSCTLDGKTGAADAEEMLAAADAVIVTVVSKDRRAMETRLKEKTDAEIIWLEDIVADMAKLAAEKV